MRHNLLELKIRKVRRGFCGHAIVKTILEAFNSPESDEVILKEMVSDGQLNSSDQIVGFLEARGLETQEVEWRAEGWRGVSEQLDQGALAFTAVKNCRGGALDHWVILPFIGKAVVIVSLGENRVQKWQHFNRRVVSSVWVVKPRKLEEGV